MTQIYIEDYSTKSFVVRGDTTPIKENMKALGGKWNSNLTNKSTGEKFGAWLFWSDKRTEVSQWIEKGCKNLSSLEPKKKSIGENTEISMLNKKIDYLTSIVEMLCVAQGVSIEQVICEEDMDLSGGEEQDDKPRKRLMKRK